MTHACNDPTLSRSLSPAAPVPGPPNRSTRTLVELAGTHRRHPYAPTTSVHLHNTRTPPQHPFTSTTPVHSITLTSVVVGLLGSAVLALKLDNDRHAKQMHAAALHLDRLVRRVLDTEGSGEEEHEPMGALGEVDVRHGLDMLAGLLAAKEQQAMALQEETQSMSVLHQVGRMYAAVMHHYK